MTSTFDFDGMVKTVQVDSLKPSTVAKLFRLDLNTLVLSDVQGCFYSVEDGDKFNPLLTPNKAYAVDGVSLTTINSSGETQTALSTMNKDLKVIQGSQQLNLVQDVITTCKDMNESADLLYHGPQAVVMVQCLAVLAVCAPDPTLNIDTLNPDTKKRLGDPGSFRASLLHLANRMCDAFLQADYSMKKIRACLVDLPDYFDATLEVVDQTEDINAQKVLNTTVQQIEKSSKKCSTMAQLAKTTFDEVILDIDALSVAATSSKTVNEREKEELKKLKDEMEIWIKKKQIDEQQLRKEYEESQKRAKQALEDYRKQMKDSVGLGKLFLATLVDGANDFVMVGAQLIPSKRNLLNAVNAVNPFASETVSCSNSMKHVVENALMHSFEKIGSTLSDPENLDIETISDYITSIKDFQKYSPATDEGSALFKKANEVQIFLKKYKKFLEKGDELDDKMKAQISSIRTSVQNTVQLIRSALVEQQKNEMTSKDSLRTQLLEADSQRLNSSQEHWKTSDAKEEKVRKELYKTTNELTEFICKVKSIDTNTVDLVEIIKYLQCGIKYLAKVKKTWQFLVSFFNNIQIIVDENLVENVKSFVQEAKDPASRTIMLRAALKATGYCIQVSNAAHLYSVVSGKYIMPIISSIGEQLALEPNEAKSKHQEIERSFMVMNNGVKDLIEKEQAEIEQHFYDKMERFAQRMAKSVKVGNIAAAKAIKH
jgi:hypothetical protein